MKSRPASIRIRLSEPPVRNAITLALPTRSMFGVSLVLAGAFVIFAFIEWTTVAGMFGRNVDDLFDLTFLVFQGFWALGWLVGVLLLGALTILFAFYSESAHLEEGKLVHVPRLGPLKFLIDYDLSKIRNVRLERARGSEPDTVQVRFDYDGRATSLGNAMPRPDGERIVHTITAAMRFAPTVPTAPIAPIAPTAPIAPIVPMSAFALIAANLVPVVGVLLFGWDLGDIMLLYWVESGVIAFYTAIKIAVVGKLAAVAAVPFFVGHFGGFMTAHFLLIYALFLRSDGWQVAGPGDALRTIFVPIWGSVAALVISHGISLYTNFIGRREYERETVRDLMTSPYNRVIVMHVTLILGGWIVLLIGMPAGALVVLVVLKSLVDLHAHRAEHDGSRKVHQSRQKSEIYSAAI